MMNYEKKVCCICGPGSSKTAGVNAALPAEGLGFAELQDQWNGFFKDTDKERSFFSYVRCVVCGLLYCTQYFYAEQLANLYQNMPDNTADVDLSSLRKTQYGYFQTLLPYLDNLHGDYFEMGPDIGLFTEHVLKTNQFEKIWLAEPNRAVWLHLQQLLKTQPSQLFSDMVQEDPIPNAVLGAAVMIHVLDHVLDPVDVLQHLHAKMRDGGILAIVTHDESSLLANLLKKRWPAYCLQHPQLYRPKSIKHLLEKAGFKVLEVQKTYNHFPFGYLLNHLVWALGFKKKIFPDWKKLQLPLKLGNIITIATK
ncbi:MAG: class I SAM-dependent methyltransferase [Gammaproteobacteria bacterium]|nr:class I SAM-dependent methyltransferase [Gammaproteobacteria bacterium]